MLQIPTEKHSDRLPDRAIRSPVLDGGARQAASLMLANLVSALRRRRMVLLLCIVLIPMIAYAGLKQVTPRYTAEGSVIYEPSSYSVQEIQSILRPDPITDEVISSQAEIIRSLHAADRLVDKFDLMERPEFNWTLQPPSLSTKITHGLRSALAAALGQIWPAASAWVAPAGGEPLPPEADIRRSVVQSVQAAILVEPVRSSHVLNVSFTSQDRDLAANAVNALMDFYISDQLQTKFDAVRGASKWLETRVQDLQKEVQNWDDRIAAYQSKSGLTQGVQAGLATEEVSRLSDSLVAARNDLAQAEGRLDAARGRAGAAAQAAVSPSVVALRSQQDTLNAQLQSLLARFGPSYPDVISLRQQLAEVQRAVGAETGRVVAASDADVRAARAKVASLEQALRQTQQQVATHTQAQIPLDAMKREEEASRNLLQAVLGSIQRISQQAAIEKPDSRVISAALPPAEPSFPKTKLLLAAAVAFGICFGLLVVYLLEISDSTFRSGDDVRTMLNLPCVALVPQIKAPPGRRSVVEDYVVQKPLSLFAEQMRALRAAFWLGSNPAKVIAITAARPAEGKTTTALSLGRAAALNGERVIVVECDVRQPSFGRVMRADDNLGVVGYLRGKASLQEVIRTDKLTNLAYIPAGKMRGESLGLYMSDAMGALLARLKREYDLVLLDSPPVFAMTDARVVARLADATLLCVRWRETPHSVVSHSLEMLQEAGAQVIGVALTRVDTRSHAKSGTADAEAYHPRYAGYYRD